MRDAERRGGGVARKTCAATRTDGSEISRQNNNDSNK